MGEAVPHSGAQQCTDSGMATDSLTRFSAHNGSWVCRLLDGNEETAELETKQYENCETARMQLIVWWLGSDRPELEGMNSTFALCNQVAKVFFCQCMEFAQRKKSFKFLKEWFELLSCVGSSAATQFNDREVRFCTSSPVRLNKCRCYRIRLDEKSPQQICCIINFFFPIKPARCVFRMT